MIEKEPKPERKRKGRGDRERRRTACPRPAVSFPIVGIGASASGLEALEHFLGRVPAGSGMGSDGTLGLRAIKEKGGLALVQEPAMARFDGMPRRAIDAGVPYRTWDNRIDGVVITFTDVTTAKKLEGGLRNKQASLEKRVARPSAKLGWPRRSQGSRVTDELSS